MFSISPGREETSLACEVFSLSFLIAILKPKTKQKFTIFHKQNLFKTAIPNVLNITTLHKPNRRTGELVVKTRNEVVANRENRVRTQSERRVIDNVLFSVACSAILAV